jgi:hypothetical protein
LNSSSVSGIYAVISGCWRADVDFTTTVSGFQRGMEVPHQAMAE